MDIYCKICGEPWDTDTLHEEVAARKAVGHSSTYRGVWRDFGMRGCVALSTSMGTGPCARPGRKADPRIAAIYDVFGDDVDGAAAELEDLLG